MATKKTTKKETEVKKEVKKEPEKKGLTAKVVGGDLNVRITRTVDTLDNIACVLPDGTEVEILKEGREWCQIEGGYVMRKYLSFE